MRKQDKITKKQVLAIPKLLETKNMSEVANLYNVSYQAVWYWVEVLKKKGFEVTTRPQGHRGLLD